MSSWTGQAGRVRLDWLSWTDACWSYRNVRGRIVRVVEAFMVAMMSAMFAFSLILIDRNCQERQKDKNQFPLEVRLGVDTT